MLWEHFARSCEWPTRLSVASWGVPIHMENAASIGFYRNHQPNIKLFVYSVIFCCNEEMHQHSPTNLSKHPKSTTIFFSQPFPHPIHARKLVPFLAAQETFKAQAEAKYLADELEAKLAPAEAVDRWSGWQRGRIEDRSIWISEDVFKFIKIKQIWGSMS